MEYRKYLILIVLLTGFFCANAQDNTLPIVDSTSYSLYRAGNWKELITYGNECIEKGTDFINLRLRIGYACFVTENYKLALQQYENILGKDSYNQTARYFAYYCNKYLNNENGASYHAAFIDKETLSKENIKPYGLTEVCLESSLKMPGNIDRGNAIYTRLGLSNRLGWRLQVSQSVSYFNQYIKPAFVIFDMNNSNKYSANDNQFEYYLKLSYSLNSKLSAIGSYHYVNTSYQNNSYNSNLGLLGLRYTSKYLDLQGDVNFGTIINEKTQQYNATITYYPTGNFNLYTTSKASVKHVSAENHFIFSQAIGFRAAKKLWFESSATFGNQSNYVDADGLYIYNAIDDTKFKFGQTVFYQLNIHTLIQLNYTYENKTDFYRAFNYDQHAITAGIVWKF